MSGGVTPGRPCPHGDQETPWIQQSLCPPPSPPKQAQRDGKSTVSMHMLGAQD